MRTHPRSRLELADGRTLAYGSFGDSGGAPLLLLDGPGSRVAAHFAHDPAVAAGVYVIAPDRPGMGDSDPQPGRTIPDWAADAGALADHLEWDRFAALGVSGGCPYACVTAKELGERVSRLGIVGGTAPLDLPGVRHGMSWATRSGYFFARRAPWVLRQGFRRMGARAQRHPEEVAQRLMATRPEDQFVMRTPGREVVIDGMPVMWRSADANAHEFVLLTRAWGFEVEEISVPTLLWYGEADTVHPPAMGRALEERSPGARATYVADAGSFAFITHLEPILRTLTGTQG